MGRLDGVLGVDFPAKSETATVRIDAKKPLRAGAVAAAVTEPYTCELVEFAASGEARLASERITFAGPGGMELDVRKAESRRKDETEKKEEQAKLDEAFAALQRALRDGGKAFRITGWIAPSTEGTLALVAFEAIEKKK